MNVALIGNPNAGKTTLFNQLTKRHQQVGNWPGVTVDRYEGQFICNGQTIHVVDLPGTYSLTANCDNTPLDKQIVFNYMVQEQPDLLVNVVDASVLPRHLYLTSQLLCLSVPLIIVLNMHDVAQKKGIDIDIQWLEQHLHCPVIPLVANKGCGIKKLQQAIVTPHPPRKKMQLSLPQPLTNACQSLHGMLGFDGNLSASGRELLAMCLLECPHTARHGIPDAVTVHAQEQIASCTAALGEGPDLFFADARYQQVEQWYTASVTHKKNTCKHTDIDRVLLHRFWGLPLFFLMMYGLFALTLNVGGLFQDCFEIIGDLLFVSGPIQLMQQWHCPDWMVIFLSHGIGQGMYTVFNFVPVLFALFLGLSLLEDSGYMARAAFVVDKAMHAIGLSGQSFVPMLVGLGCNVPAIIATRTCAHPKERILTMLMIPFMSCGARLAIYTVFVSAFFKAWGGTVIFMLYMVGILVAVLTAYVMRKTVLQGPTSGLIMELPPYHVPQMRMVLKRSGQRLWQFISRAGSVIVPVAACISVFSHIDIHIQGQTYPLLASIGHGLTPLLAPMGIHADNWPAAVSLFTGILAKEVVIGTLNALTHPSILLPVQVNLVSDLVRAVSSIYHNVLHLGSFSWVPDSPPLSQNIGQHFDGKKGIFAYLLFVLLYFPCVSTTVAIAKELNWRWASLAMLWSLFMAYAIAVFYYQCATLLQHRVSGLLTLGVVCVCFVGVLQGLRRLSKPAQGMLS